MWKMEIVKTLVLVFFAGLLVFLPEMEAQIQAPPLCVSQYALVNYACAFTRTRPSFEDDDRVYLLGHEEGNGHGQNYTQAHMQAQRSQDEHGHRNGSSRRHGHEGGHNHRPRHESGHKHRHEYEGGHNHRPRHEGGHNHRHEHEGRHNQRSRHEGGHNHRHEYQHRSRHEREHEHGREREHEHEHGSRHRRRHRSHHHHEDECCKWLNELDDICVCNLLVRLPPFLSRLEHKYSIRVGDTCKVSYKCEGRRL